MSGRSRAGYLPVLLWLAGTAGAAGESGGDRPIMFALSIDLRGDERAGRRSELLLVTVVEILSDLVLQRGNHGRIKYAVRRRLADLAERGE